MNALTHAVKGIGFAARLAVWGYNFAQRFTANKRAADQERRRAWGEQQQQETILRWVTNPQASGVHGSARLGTLLDTHAAGLVSGGQGIYLAIFEGVALSLNDPNQHCLIYAKTGAGKLRDHLAIVAATVFDRTVVFSDIKNGEVTFAAMEWRKAQGGRVVCINPDKLGGIEGARFNPLREIAIAYAERPDLVRQVAEEIARMVVPDPKTGDKWPQEGAREMFAAVALYFAATYPERCRLSELQAFFNGKAKDLKARLEAIGADTRAPADVREEVLGILDTMDSAKPQFAAERSTLRKALRPFAPGSHYAVATDATDDPLDWVKREQGSIFVMGDGTRNASAGSFMALMMHALIEACARAKGPGRVLFALDEFKRLPRIAAIEKAIDLYRGKGIQLLIYAQTRPGLIDTYGKPMVENLEGQCGAILYMGCEDEETLRHIETISGKTTIVVRHVGAGTAASPAASFGVSETARPILQIDDIRRLGPSKAVLRVSGHPLFVVDRLPYFQIKQCAGIRDPREAETTTNWKE